MSCLLDPFGCFLAGLPWWVPWLFWGGVALFVIGAAWRLVTLAHGLGGRIGASGAVAVILAAVAGIASIFRRKPKVSNEDQYPDPGAPPRKPSTLRRPGEPANDWFKRVTGQD